MPGQVSALRCHGPFKRLEVALAGLERPFEFDLLSDAPPACGEHVYLRIQGGHVFPNARNAAFIQPVRASP